MAKSAWKFYQTNIYEVYLYSKEYLRLNKNKNKQVYGSVSNNLKINTINYMYRYTFYQGSTYIRKRFSKFFIGSIGYCFLKFRKPF